jgi:16S rRNA (adenine1518-N6/adenine1519-N6)-dimethyltransferase
MMVKKILEKYNKKPKKSLGQNFLTNPETLKKTAEISLNECSGENCGVIEIGPGTGELTARLCALYKKVVAVELDGDFEPILSETLSGFDNFKIIFGDILKIDLNELTANQFAGFEKVNICANLPYCITTPVVLKLVKSGANFGGITVMVQKEAADKLCSGPGGENYTATSAILGYYGTAKKMFAVPNSDFYPPPKVLSAAVRIIPHSSPAAVPKSEELMYKVIEAAFGQRRKTLVNALSSGLCIDKQKITEIVISVTGNENIRGEELGIKAFSDISDLIFERI